MRHLHGLAGFDDLPRGCGLTVGNFDGLHLGHRRLLRELRRRCAGCPTAVVTFEPHPLTRLRPQAAPPRLTTAAQKATLLADAGVDALLTLAPDDDVLSLDAAAFVDLLLRPKPGAIVEGRDFHFGKGRSGNLDVLRQLAGDTPVVVVEPAEVALTDATRVAAGSSLCRWLLAHGRARDAALVLGRPYRLSGVVERGLARGRTLGFPTANLAPDDQLVPADGVYAARAAGAFGTRLAAVSVGTNPTFDGPTRTVEAHLLDFDADLYGQPLDLDFVDWLRPQVKYPDAAALVAQLHADVAHARTRAALDPAAPIYRVA